MPRPPSRAAQLVPAWALVLALVLALAPACADSAEGAADDSGPPAGEPRPAPPVDQAAFEQARNRAFQLHEAGGDLLAARDALLEAHALDPSAFGVNRRLGLVYTDLGLHVDAVEHFAEAARSKPEDLDVRQHLVALLAQLDRMEEAREHLPPLKQHPDYAGEALYLEATMADMAGDREGALALVEQAADLDPASAHRALALHGRFRFQEGDLEGALEKFAASQAGRPDYKAALKGLADCHRRLGDADRADHYETVLGLVLDLTDDEFVRKRKVLRREKLTALLELLPEWAAGYRELADLHRREGRLEAACQVIERFLAQFPEQAAELDVDALRERYCEETP